MHDVNYKRKYLKYKSKYIELKRGGGDGKKVKFSEIKEKFNKIKADGKKLYFEDNTKQIVNITEGKYNKTARSKKDNYYLSINFQYIKNGKMENDYKSIDDNNFFAGLFNSLSTPTYNVEIKPQDKDYILIICFNDCKGISS